MKLFELEEFDFNANYSLNELVERFRYIKGLGYVIKVKHKLKSESAIITFSKYGLEGVCSQMKISLKEEGCFRCLIEVNEGLKFLFQLSPIWMLFVAGVFSFVSGLMMACAFSMGFLFFKSYGRNDVGEYRRFLALLRGRV